MFTDLMLNVYGYANGDISGARLSYKVVGTVASTVAPGLYGAIVGSELMLGVGTLIGIGVGLTFMGAEYLYDNYPAMKQTVNDNYCNAVDQYNRVESALHRIYIPN